MVFGEAALSQRLAARSLEIEAGRVHEHEVELAEQIAPAREQLLFDDVLQAARRTSKSMPMPGAQAESPVRETGLSGACP